MRRLFALPRRLVALPRSLRRPLVRHRCADAAATYEQRQIECVARLADNRPVACFSPRQDRQVVDGVATAAECRRAVTLAKVAMRICCDDDGSGSRLFPPHVPEAAPLLGDHGSMLFEALRDRVSERVRAYHGAVEPVNSLISWISGREGCVFEDDEPPPRSFDWQRDALHGTYAPHVDKANQPVYDVSALLYLTTAGLDFSGGAFAFNDEDCDRLVRPSAGKLLTFTSGFENLHQVRPVRRGERLVLSIWYKRSLG